VRLERIAKSVIHENDQIFKPGKWPAGYPGFPVCGNPGWNPWYWAGQCNDGHIAVSINTGPSMLCSALVVSFGNRKYPHIHPEITPVEKISRRKTPIGRLWLGPRL